MKRSVTAIVLMCLILGTSVSTSAEEAPAGKETLKIELPAASFSGTPVPYFSPCLEVLDYKNRPDYYVPEGVKLVSKGKTVTSSCAEPLLGKLTMITDGNKNYAKASLIELESGVQWVQIDLEKEADIYAIMVWHFHEKPRVYFDLIARVSNYKHFKAKENIREIYNNDFDNSAGMGIGKDNEYIEDYRGHLIKIPNGAKGRYVRLYSQGNTANDMNHYVEIEVFGK